MEKPENPLVEDKPLESYNLVIEAPQAGVEKFYFWSLQFLSGKSPFGFEYKVEKIKDVFSATETSSYFGATEQKKGMQQEKAAQYLRGISEMLKGLFQIVRELRIVDERLDYYNKSNERDKDAEVALKGIWVDMVEGGAKNPSSVYGLAREVGFAILPDLFFSIHPKDKDSIEIEVNGFNNKKGLGLNRKQREIVGRKLFQYLVWKERTEKEIKTRRNWSLKYLRQHYNVIKLYMNWVRPYLRNVAKLELLQRSSETPELVTAFDTTLIELELIGYNEKKFKHFYPALVIKFKYTAMPQMAYQEEGGVKGAIHTGKTEITYQAYALTKEQIEEYKKKQESDDIELLGNLDETMKSLGDEFKKYLEEGGEKFKEEEKPKEPEIKHLSMLEPFTSLGGAFKELISFTGFKKHEKQPKINLSEKQKAEEQAKTLIFVMYDVTKKVNGMLAP